jgi:hypothetical protein
MTHFQALLQPADSTSTPTKEQNSASCRLFDEVKKSRLGWWMEQASRPRRGTVLLLVVAPYSQYDLALLDVLDAFLARPSATRSKSVSVYVANLESYSTVKQLANDIPTITQAPPQSPVAALWVNGKLSESAWGKPGRDLAAKAVGLTPEDLNQSIVARIPNGTLPTLPGK